MNATSLPRLPSIKSFPRRRAASPLRSLRSGCVPPRSTTVPEPPTRVSLPAPPSMVVGMVSAKTPLLSSMRTRSSPRRRVERDAREVVAFEAEVGRAVVADVDLENAGVAGLQAKRDLVAPRAFP